MLAVEVVVVVVVDAMTLTKDVQRRGNSNSSNNTKGKRANMPLYKSRRGVVVVCSVVRARCLTKSK